MLLNQDTRQYLSLVDKLEGEQIAAVLPSQAENTPYIKEEDKISSFVSRSLLSLRPGKNLVIRMINPPANTDVFVTINGENAGNFHEGSLKLTVFEGDYVEIDVTALKQQPARFVIDASREDVITPQPGLLLEATEPIIVVGRVKLK
ncbi:hypothetical protein [Methylomusa anaerophila]|uniref:hypothetical protein n=1 Tax=Methylomusa anaerophila TaxID=1930071 RepID=UPI0011AEB9F1|nr:hypothetical protein [Methylomusa anaerophila]